MDTPPHTQYCIHKVLGTQVKETLNDKCLKIYRGYDLSQ